MRRVAIALLLLVAVALAAGTALARPPATSALRVVERTPLVVRGANFHSTERVTLRAPGVVRVVHTTASGVFRTRLGAAPTDRCSFLIVAVGASGDHAQARVFPRVRCARPRSRCRYVGPLARPHVLPIRSVYFVGTDIRAMYEFSSFAVSPVFSVAVQRPGGFPGVPVPGQRNRSGSRVSDQIGSASLPAVSSQM